MSQEEQNKAVVAKYFAEFWGKANPDVVDDVCSEDFVIDYPIFGPRYGKEEAKNLIKGFKMVMPDVRFEGYEFPLIAEGPYVVGRWIGGGTHSGIALNDLPIGSLAEAETGRKLRITGTTIFTLKDGKIVLERGEEGVMQALQQLQILPPSNAAYLARYEGASQS